jgi:hypothetical protein
MIENDDQLHRTRNAVNDLELALAALKREVYPINPQRFVVMAEPVVDQLQELRREIDEYIGVASVIGREAEVWLGLQGPDIALGNTPTSVLSTMTDLLRRGVQIVAEYLQRGSVGARPTAEIKQACDFRIIGLAPGSLNVGLRLPDPSDLNVDNDEALQQAWKALDLYLRAVEWVGSEDDIELLETEIPDNDERRLLLSQVARIIPRPRGGVEVVSFSGRSLKDKTVRLNRQNRERVREAIKRTITETPAIIAGTLREIDLDNRSFIVRNAESSSETRCEIRQDADDLMDIAKEALDHEVIVLGIKRSDRTRRQTYPILVTEIEVFDQDPVDELPPF